MPLTPGLKPDARCPDGNAGPTAAPKPHEAGCACAASGDTASRATRGAHRAMVPPRRTSLTSAWTGLYRPRPLVATPFFTATMISLNVHERIEAGRTGFRLGGSTGPCVAIRLQAVGSCTEHRDQPDALTQTCLHLVPRLLPVRLPSLGKPAHELEPGAWEVAQNAGHDQDQRVLLEVQLMHSPRRGIDHLRVERRRTNPERHLVVAGRTESPLRFEHPARLRGGRPAQDHVPDGRIAGSIQWNATRIARVHRRGTERWAGRGAAAAVEEFLGTHRERGVVEVGHWLAGAPRRLHRGV